MPAYVGGECDMAGIKWIASYPDNINHGITRAHSVVVLNNSETGIVEAIINTPLLSIIRTAAVTGFFIEQVSRVRNLEHCKVGIIGLGPIGQNHLKMCTQILLLTTGEKYVEKKQQLKIGIKHMVFKEKIPITWSIY